MYKTADKSSTRIITWLTSIVVAIVVVVLPLGYFLISYKYIAGSIETEAEIKARLISNIISQSPDMWQYENIRIEEYLSRRPGKQVPEIRRVFDNKRTVVAESIDEIPFPTVTKSASIYDSGIVVGSIEISRTLSPLLKKTGALLLALLPAGLIIVYIMGVVPIRTIRRTVSEALQKEKDTAQQYLDIAGVIMVAIDTDYRITLINRKGCEVLGYSEQEALGKNWIETFIPEKNHADIKHSFLMLGCGNGLPQNTESLILTKNAEERVIEWNHVAILDSDGSCKGVISSGNDITDSKNVELQLLHSQKIESVGQYTSSISHEFNNILTVISSYCCIIRKKIEDNQEACKTLDHVVAAADRAATLTQKLLLFSRKEVVIAREHDLNEIVGNFKNFISKIIGTKVSLSSNYCQNPLNVIVDKGQIEQILMNLSTNARDAMPKGGKLSISTSQINMDNEFIKTHGFGKNGFYAVITVKDTGMGMDSETQKMLFEPFFTTKKSDKGTGLGMAIVQRIINSHQGFISVESSIGEGTTFNIYIPTTPLQSVFNSDMLLLSRPEISL